MTEADNTRQTWNTKSYQSDTGFVSKYGEGVVEWLDPKPGERILDLGCGDGKLTGKISESGAEVVGVDSSPSFIESAKSVGLDAHLMDGQSLQFDSEFDAVFTSAALHWMLEPQKVVDGVKRALKPGGRFVGEFGAFGNVAAVSSAMRAVGDAMGGNVALAGPWFFPTTEQYRDILEASGFEVRDIISFARPTPLPNGMKAWLGVMRAPFFEQFGRREEEAYEKVLSALKPSMCDHKGKWFADYVRLRFSSALRE